MLNFNFYISDILTFMSYRDHRRVDPWSKMNFLDLRSLKNLSIFRENSNLNYLSHFNTSVKDSKKEMIMIICRILLLNSPYCFLLLFIRN